MSTIASYYKVNGEKLRRSYKKNLSNFATWEQKDHAEQYLVYPENISSRLAIDEISLSKGDLYTFVTSKEHTGNKKKLGVTHILWGVMQIIYNLAGTYEYRKGRSITLYFPDRVS